MFSSPRAYWIPLPVTAALNQMHGEQRSLYSRLIQSLFAIPSKEQEGCQSSCNSVQGPLFSASIWGRLLSRSATSCQALTFGVVGVPKLDVDARSWVALVATAIPKFDVDTVEIGERFRPQIGM
jgi:hypothetical protein